MKQLEQINYTQIIYFVVAIFFIFLVTYTATLIYPVGCSNDETILRIKDGSTGSMVANDLYDLGCIDSPSILKAALKLGRKSTSIKTGRYSMKGISTVGELIVMITNTSKNRVRVTFIEGWEIDKYAEVLQRKMGIDKERFLFLCKDHNFINSLGLNTPTLASLEGFLYPDTYIFLDSYIEEDIIRVMVNQFKYIYDNFIYKKNTPNGLNMYESVIMASIIQGEAYISDEMPKISSVYHNRLKKNMLLQADPTIQYIIPGPNIRLYNKHLKINSRYNTYKYKGLPPGPINNPGFSALAASINPISTNFLYFVADGTGRHVFTKTNKDHVREKERIKRQRRRK